MSSGSNDDYLERVKAEIRAEADLARARTPLPRRDPPAAAPRPHDGIEYERLDYAIGELTGAHYSAFLDGAFRALLKRPPDAAGSAAQMRLLGAGASKAEILGNLRWSPEGKRIGARVHGLLPRYALAKLGRMPLLGYVIDWGIALAGLPILLRHQRAADTLVAARFNATADAHREHDRRLQELDNCTNERAIHIDQRFAEIGDDIRRAQLRLDRLEQRASALESRANALEHGRAGDTLEMAGLRHSVHTTNHWVVSLQCSLATIEEAAQAQRARADRLATATHDYAGESAERALRYRTWASELAARVPAASVVLDLGSGDGAWLDALRARDVSVRGVETNAVWVERAMARGTRIALGDPQGTLARCPDASLGGVVIAGAIAANDMAITELLTHAHRALQAEGCLLLRLEHDATGLASMPLLDVAHWIAILHGARFVAVSELAATGGTALFARRA